jgi:hypothetical protein
MPAELLAGRMLESTPVNETCAKGTARTTNTRTADAAQTSGRRMTSAATRYQRPPRALDAGRCQAVPPRRVPDALSEDGQQ